MPDTTTARGACVCLVRPPCLAPPRTRARAHAPICRWSVMPMWRQRSRHCSGRRLSSSPISFHLLPLAATSASSVWSSSGLNVPCQGRAEGEGAKKHTTREGRHERGSASWWHTQPVGAGRRGGARPLQRSPFSAQPLLPRRHPSPTHPPPPTHACARTHPHLVVARVQHAREVRPQALARAVRHRVRDLGDHAVHALALQREHPAPVLAALHVRLQAGGRRAGGRARARGHAGSSGAKWGEVSAGGRCLAVGVMLCCTACGAWQLSGTMHTDSCTAALPSMQARCAVHTALQ
jgi:hypothetical protein